MDLQESDSRTARAANLRRLCLGAPRSQLGVAKPALVFCAALPAYDSQCRSWSSKCEVTAAPALAVVASLWRGFEICDATSWGELHEKNTEVLATLQHRGLLRPGSDNELISERWAFPLFGLDLTEDRSVSLNDLRRLRGEAEARWIARETGYSY
jgi:hypothetical protein